MYQSDIKTSGHIWIKKNLVTIVGKGKMYDQVVCENCGMRGERHGFTSVAVSEAYKFENVHKCPKVKQEKTPGKVKVTKCTAVGSRFLNLLPGSIHEVIAPPEGYKNDHTGVWVMGVGEPVKLLPNEFVPCD